MIFQAGESYVVNVVVGNFSTVKIKAILVELCQTADIIAYDDGRANRSFIQTVLSSTRLDTVQINAGMERRERRPARNVAVAVEEAAVEEVDAAVVPVSITVPDSVLASSQGRLINLSHEIVVRAITPFGSSNPSSSMRVIVVGPSLHQATSAVVDNNAHESSSNMDATSPTAYTVLSTDSPMVAAATLSEEGYSAAVRSTSGVTQAKPLLLSC